MKKCEKCKVNIVGKRKYCPLCQGLLTGSDDEQKEIFPTISTIYRQHNLFFKIMILISIAISTVAVAVNIMLPQRGWWSFFIIAGVCSIWLSLSTAIKKRKNIPKNIVYQVIIISFVVVMWDYVTKWRGWSINYVIPLICIFAMISMTIISKILKLHIEDYIIYLIIDGLFGIIPIVFIIAGDLNVLYPSLLCIVTSIISFTSLLLFEGESMFAEIKRRLHL